jgi:hypothetical protein
MTGGGIMIAQEDMKGVNSLGLISMASVYQQVTCLHCLVQDMFSKLWLVGWFIMLHFDN